MLRIRRVADPLALEDRSALARVQEVLRDRLPAGQRVAGSEEMAAIDRLPDLLRDPVKYEYKTLLLVADDLQGRLAGFALASYTSSPRASSPNGAYLPSFVYLDVLVALDEHRGRAVEEALYRRLEEHVADLAPIGVFAEAAPSDPKLVPRREDVQRNEERLIFLEGLGLRPLVGVGYENATAALDDGPRHLLFAGREPSPPRAAEVREVVRILLETQYAGRLGGEAIERAVAAVTADPVAVRPPRSERKTVPAGYRRAVPEEQKVLLVSNEEHAIHDVKRRGNVQVPARLLSVLREAALTDLFARERSREYGDEHVTAVHGAYYDYLREACLAVGPDRVVYPSVFPRRHYDRPPEDYVQRLGYHCVDLFTPLNANAFRAARAAVDCALTAADALAAGDRRLAYALVRPPGHHAERDSFGGYCYLNSSSIAAHHLSRDRRVAILDLDYHHGNGHQDVFYARDDVLTVSIHRDPRFEYPFFAGFADEVGEGAGHGCNRNFPLGPDVDGAAYRRTLAEAIAAIADFAPDVLVVPLGLDTARLDPLATWTLVAEDFTANGRMVAGLGVPTLVVQEGGYNTRNLGRNACHFFVGLWEGTYLS